MAVLVVGGHSVAVGAEGRLRGVFGAVSGAAFNGVRQAGLAAFETHLDYLDVARQILRARLVVGDVIELVSDGVVLDRARIGVVSRVISG